MPRFFSFILTTIKKLKRRWKFLWAFILSGVIGFLLIPIPTFENTPYATLLEADDGALLGARIANDGQWRFPLTDSIPPKFKNAILLFEDEYFYSHPGINPISTLKAISQNFKSGKIKRGGSTISMQVVRLARKNKKRTVLEKVTEMLMALKMELTLPKDEILSMYIVHAPFGGNVVGLPAASWRYYGRPPELLSWAEIATLAVLPNAPSLIYPGKNSEFLLKKRNGLLDKLFSRGYITSSDVYLAKDEGLPGQPKQLPSLDGRLLSRAINEGFQGQAIKTSINAQLQQLVKEKVQKHHQQMVQNYVYNVAALVIEVKSGKAIAYIGNADTEGGHGQDVDIITSKRSTGSLLKPILYAAAIDEGLITPRQLLPDIPVFIQGFAPQNFNKKFHGAVHADKALARSLNVPFVHLLKQYGYENFYQKLKGLGVASLNKPASHYGLSIILGGGESSLWEITSVYAGMARSLNNYFIRPVGKQYSDNDFFGNIYRPIEDGKPMETDIQQNFATKDENIMRVSSIRGKSNTFSEETSNKGKLSAASISLMLKAMQGLNRPEEERVGKLLHHQGIFPGKQAQVMALKTPGLLA